jgi:hypothetical protein
LRCCWLLYRWLRHIGAAAIIWRWKYHDAALLLTFKWLCQRASRAANDRPLHAIAEDVVIAVMMSATNRRLLALFRRVATLCC